MPIGGVVDRNKMLRVAVVGACASGKSTLVEMLRQAGYDARHVAQEHSYVPEMWRRIGRPDVLIYLDADFPAIRARRSVGDFRPEHLEEQKRRLAHARAHCDLYLNTSDLEPTQVQEQVLTFLKNRG